MTLRDKIEFIGLDNNFGKYFGFLSHMDDIDQRELEKTVTAFIDMKSKAELYDEIWNTLDDVLIKRMDLTQKIWGD